MNCLLEVTNLRRSFTVAGERRWRPQTIHAVDDLSLHINRQETVALVGESGCGKSTAGLTVLRLLEPTDGAVHFDGASLQDLSAKDLRGLRSRMQVVLQDPRSQLNPRLSVMHTIAEPLRAQSFGNDTKVRRRVLECLELVSLDPAHAKRYPHQLSGGQRQRVAIARAISTSPELVVLDEAVSALDVSVQTQVMNLLRDLQDELGMSYLFISHSMTAVRYLANRVVVMYLGRDVETAPAADFFAEPAHPYSQALLSAVPVTDSTNRRDRVVLRGDVPSPFNVPSGCVFRTRCPRAQDVCATVTPPRTPLPGGRTVSCHFPLVDTQGSTI